MPKTRHMYPDLVRSSRLNPHLDERELAVGRLQSLQHLVVAYRVAPTRAPRRHARSPRGVAGDRSIDRALQLLGPAMHQGNVFLMDLASRKLFCELAVR